MTKLTKIVIGIAILVGAVAAIAISTMRHSQPAPVAQAQTKAPAAEVSDNPLDALSGGDPKAVTRTATLLLQSTGGWHGFDTYNVKVASESDLKFPVTVDGTTFPDKLALAASISPIYTSEAKGMTCNFFCWNDEGRLLGYLPEAYAKLAISEGLPEKPTITQPTVATPADVERVDPSTDSNAPTDAIRAAINADNKLTEYTVFPVQTWKETNTYTRKIDDETVTIVEFHGTFHIRPDQSQYVGSKGGISYPTDHYERDGQVALVRRGNGWYVYKG